MSDQLCTMHSAFLSKSVFYLHCSHCDRTVCRRGMKAILLADTNVELYSTDLPPVRGVQLVGEDYRTKNCVCCIRDIACLGCGNVVGYHVTLPCHSCLQSCNNGHFWMYNAGCVWSEERVDKTGMCILTWANLEPSCGSQSNDLTKTNSAVEWEVEALR